MKLDMKHLDPGRDGLGERRLEEDITIGREGLCEAAGSRAGSGPGGNLYGLYGSRGISRPGVMI